MMLCVIYSMSYMSVGLYQDLEKNSFSVGGGKLHIRTVTYHKKMVYLEFVKLKLC